MERDIFKKGGWRHSSPRAAHNISFILRIKIVILSGSMCKCMRISKTHIIIGLRNKRFGKGRKTGTKTLKKRIRFSFWTKA